MGRYHAPSSLDSSLISTYPSSTQSRKPRTAPVNPPIRFEMPFAIWCTTCPSTSPSALIGQGVRFNAQKRRVGNYFSTPVWSFRIKHTACGGGIEIRTDPANSDFVVTEGARRRDTGDDAVVAARDDALLLEGARLGSAVGEEEKKRREDAFVALEGKAADKMRGKKDSERLDDLKSLTARDWKDPDAAGAKVRAAFRGGRRKRQADDKTKERVQEAMGLGFELLDEAEEDARRAGFVEFGEVRGGDDEGSAELKAASGPLFGSQGPQNGAANGSKTGERSGVKLRALKLELTGNTRAAIDPFSVHNGRTGGVTSNRSAQLIPSIKRKRHPSPYKKRASASTDSSACANGVEGFATSGNIKAKDEASVYDEDTRGSELKRESTVLDQKRGDALKQDAPRVRMGTLVSYDSD